MKTTIVLIAALLVNAALIFSDSLFSLSKYIHPLVLLGMEVILLIIFVFHKIMRDFSKTIQMDFGILEVFISKKKRK
ncbi:hypothetical protein [Zobellia barbeyronii]|uniref:Uncharacterized protein n=1 Tax=Zobellia barbeyronii TaxID=2748009 RepID=A0ABS5WB96_9FLAO|nr:hypothetical protein [Zobellia barbeyronii]MBT2160484.1 hypothetical protein [Zobellia barbeyronii]